MPLGASAGEQTVRGQDQFEFVYRVQLPKLEKPARLWMPLARSDKFQTVSIEKISLPREWQKVEDRDFKNQILAASLQPADSGKIIEITYGVQRIEKTMYPTGAEDPMRHLKPERLVPVNETFRSIAGEVAGGKANALERGRALYNHVLEHMKYDKSGQGWGRGDATHACNARSGNCTDFHAYFIALARSINIPARFAIGMTIPADRDEGPIAGYHCWAEFQADGKWVPVDISEASKDPELAEYYFGHHPANRFEISMGRDLWVEPAPTLSPINFLVYPLLEVDGEPVATVNEFSFRRMTVRRK